MRQGGPTPVHPSSPSHSHSPAPAHTPTSASGPLSAEPFLVNDAEQQFNDDFRRFSTRSADYSQQLNLSAASISLDDMNIGDEDDSSSISSYSTVTTTSRTTNSMWESGSIPISDSSNNSYTGFIPESISGNNVSPFKDLLRAGQDHLIRATRQLTNATIIPEATPIPSPQSNHYPIRLYQADPFIINELHPIIRLIRFDNFKRCKKFPKFPDNENMTSLLDNINRDISMIVYISHAWIHNVKHEKLKIRPDTLNNHVYKLCCDGITKIISEMAPGIQNCYIWLDYISIDQSNDPRLQLQHMADIFRWCDCMFTPLLDLQASFVPPKSINDIYSDYPSSAWVDIDDHSNPDAFLNRTWCLLEMNYNACIPMATTAQRNAKFSKGFLFNLSNDSRPHFIYGSADVMHRREPLILPPLSHVDMKRLNPLKGFLTIAEDMPIIEQLMESLQPFIPIVDEGYQGEFNDNNEREGLGQYVYSTGDIYEGQWTANKRNGVGVLRYANGSIYEGLFEWVSVLKRHPL